MDAVLGIAVGPSTARVSLIEGTRAEGQVIDEVVLEVPGLAEIIDTVVGTQRSLTGAGHRLVAVGVCVLGGVPPLALREAMQLQGVQDVVMISEGEADAALSTSAALATLQRDVAAARGAAVAAPRALYAGPPTIFRSTTGQSSMAPTHFGPVTNPRSGPFAARAELSNTELANTGLVSTHLAPTAPPPPAAAPPLAYSMTGSLGALTDYVQEYDSGPTDYYAAQASEDLGLNGFDADLGEAPEQEPERPGRKPFLLVGTLAVVFSAVALSILTTSVVLNVTPAADQTPITTSQQPVLTPLQTRAGQPPTVVPASVPVQPPPAPPVTQAPPRVNQAPTRTQTPTRTQAPQHTEAPQRTQEPQPTEAQPHSRYTPDAPPREDDGEGLPPREDEGPPAGDPAPDNRAPHSRFSPHVGDPPAERGPLIHLCGPFLPC
jgi:hypothetical protein